MEEIEYDNEESESVESGSCVRSDYNSDCSWFYDSRDLGTSYMRFSIIAENEDDSFKKEKIEKYNKNNELEKGYYSNNERRAKRIFIKKPSYNKQNSFNKKDDSLDYIDNNKKPYNYKNNYNSYNNYNYNYSENEMKYAPSPSPNFYPENYNEYENNFSAPLEEDYYQDKNINYHRSPVNATSKRRFYFNLNNNVKNEEKSYNYDNKKFEKSPRNYYKSLKNSENNDNNISEDEYNEEEHGENIQVINKNFQNKGKTIKEKIIKEVKNITLEPGETLKPKIITKKKLKPITTIVKNEDGSQSVIVENTVLTTVIVNEIIDTSTIYDDNYPVDVQFVKQYITKIYKTEIENNPYYP